MSRTYNKYWSKERPPEILNSLRDHTVYSFYSEQSAYTTWYVLGEKSGYEQVYAFREGKFEAVSLTSSTVFWDWYMLNDEDRIDFKKIYSYDKIPRTVEQYKMKRKEIMDSVCQVFKANCPPALAHTEPVHTINVPTITSTGIGMLQYHLQQEGVNPMNTINTTATVTASKTDLQTQREYLLKRWNDVQSSFCYGSLDTKLNDAFNLNVDNHPKTSKELFDGITSGKYTLDAKKSALQDIAAAKSDGGFYDDDDNIVWGPLYAFNWGGLTPDRLGYEKARESFNDQLKAAKDTIMIADPADGLAALQALEAWTPTPAAVAAPN